MEFEKGKTYVFDKEMLFKRNTSYAYMYKQMKENHNDYTSWVDDCDGKLVYVTGDNEGIVNHDGKNYAIDSNWCKVKE